MIIHSISFCADNRIPHEAGRLDESVVYGHFVHLLRMGIDFSDVVRIPSVSKYNILCRTAAMYGVQQEMARAVHTTHADVRSGSGMSFAVRIWPWHEL